MTSTLSGDMKDLPAPPVKKSDFDLWSSWANTVLKLGRSPFLRDPSIFAFDEAGDRISIACRALVATGTKIRFYPEYAPDAMLALLSNAHSISPIVLRASEILARRVMERGATSSDVLYLVAAFAWPLRDVSPEIGDRAWAYLVHAPWQTDISVLTELCKAADKSGGMGDDRNLLSLADARMEAGLRDGARELLESIAVIQADTERLENINSIESFGTKPIIEGAEQAILRLGRIYLEENETATFARTILSYASRLETEPDLMVDALQNRVWDRPFDELYEWSKELNRADKLDSELKKILDAEQPHHARRLAEAVLVRHFDEPIFRPSDRTIVRTVGRFKKAESSELLQKALARRAAEHLAVLYSRTNYYTSYARDLVDRIIQLTGFTGAGASLNPLKTELEIFVNRGDPYFLLEEQNRAFDNSSELLSDAEKRTRDAVRDWFSERFSGGNRTTVEKAITAITSPVTEAARLFGNLPGLETSCRAAFRTLLQGRSAVTGDLDPWFEEGERIRKNHGIGIELMDKSRDAARYERISAAAVSGVSAFLPPGMALAAGAADLGATLVVTYRAIARVGALYGRDVRTPDGLKFTGDSFALGCSSTDGEGLLAYLGRKPASLLTPISLGAVAYGSKTFADYLWITPGSTGRKAAEQAVRHLARLCGIGLSERSVARVVPVGGAILSGIAAYAFMSQIVEAAVNVAARDALLQKIGMDSNNQYLPEILERNERNPDISPALNSILEADLKDTENATALPDSEGEHGLQDADKEDALQNAEDESVLNAPKTDDSLQDADKNID